MKASHATLLGAALALLLLFLYRPTLAWLFNAWRYDAYYTHGFLVAALAIGLMGWTLWRGRHGAAPTSQAWWMLGLPVVAAMFLFGFLRGAPYVLVWSLFIGAAALALATGGPARLRKMAAPLLLFALALPTAWTIHVAIWLQEASTTASIAALSLFAVPLEVDLFTFQVGDTVFQVTEACSGFQGALSLLAIGAVVVSVFEMTPRRRALVLLGAVPVALALNIVRILAVVGIAQGWGAEAAEGFFHDWSGGLLFVGQTLLLLGFAGLLTRQQEVTSIA